VVADNFKFGADRNIIVALEHNVLMANKKDLTKVRLDYRDLLTIANTVIISISFIPCDTHPEDPRAK